jgi:Recombinase zinc beta ribbon domain
MWCPCGYSMKTHITKPGGHPYHYYGCARRRQLGKKCDCKQPSVQADQVEPVVWEFISGLLKDPEYIRRGIERMIALEQEGRMGNPEQEQRVWAEKLAQIDLKRSRYQEMAAEGLITFEELRAKLAELLEIREATERELDDFRNRKEHLERLEKDRDAVLESLSEMVPASLENLSGLERNKIYMMLHLRIMPTSEGYEATGDFRTNEPCSLL